VTMFIIKDLQYRMIIKDLHHSISYSHN